MKTILVILSLAVLVAMAKPNQEAGKSSEEEDYSVYIDPCGVDPVLRQKCNIKTSEEENEKCFDCVLSNCYAVALKPDVTCEEIIDCVNQSKCE